VANRQALFIHNLNSSRFCVPYSKECEYLSLNRLPLLAFDQHRPKCSKLDAETTVDLKAKIVFVFNSLMHILSYTGYKNMQADGYNVTEIVAYVLFSETSAEKPYH